MYSKTSMNCEHVCFISFFKTRKTSQIIIKKKKKLMYIQNNQEF